VDWEALVEILTVGQRDFLMASPEAARGAEADLLAAVRGGGAFVQLNLLGGSTARVLMSAGVPVYVQSQDHDHDEDEDESADAQGLSIYDWDYDSERDA
jgi:hypothetical protein